MRFVIPMCIVVVSCATTSAGKGAIALARPEVDAWSDGWKQCAEAETKEAIAAPPLEAEDSCGLGHAGCAALRAALAPCAGLSPSHLTVLVTTDANGAATDRCLAAASARVPAETLACVGTALQETKGAPSREQAAVRIDIFPNWVFVADGTGLSPAAITQTMSAAAGELGGCGTDGSYELAWKILADGSVSDVTVRSKKHQGTAPAACLTAAIAKLKFPAHATPSDDPIVFRL